MYPLVMRIFLLYGLKNHRILYPAVVELKTKQNVYAIQGYCEFF